MKRTSFLANRIREVYLNGKWIANTNLKDQIENLSLSEAFYKTGSLNTIAALVFHLNYYLEGLIKVLQGGPLDISDKYSYNLPAILEEQQWQDLKNTVLSNAAEFADLIEKLEDDKLDEPFTDARYGTYLRNLEGVVEHSYYHLGQVSILNKMRKEGI